MGVRAADRTLRTKWNMEISSRIQGDVSTVDRVQLTRAAIRLGAKHFEAHFKFNLPQHA